jgi:sigma-B regulation protein RsbU (phosphoserine phosphatase)
MFRDRSIAFKLILFFTVSSAAIFLVAFGYNYRFSRKTMERNIEDFARSVVRSAEARIEGQLLPLQKPPEQLANFLEQGRRGKDDVLHMLREVVEKNSGIFGATVAFEPYAFDGRSRYFAPYFARSNGAIRLTHLGGEAYQYFVSDWYQIPKEIGRPEWSEPYYDEGGGNILMVTYSVPFYRRKGGERRFQGVVTADISLDWLADVVSSVKVLQTGYGFLLSKNGTVVTHPAKDLVMNATIFGLAELQKDEHLRQIGKKMIRGESGFVPLRSIVFGKESRMYYAPIPCCGWSLAVVFPQDELMADITRLNRSVAILGIAGILGLSLAVVCIARSFTRPLRDMARATQDVARGNLDIELPAARSADEVGKLSEAFRYMIRSLKEHIQRLTEATAAKERIESELRIARDIQMGLLPRVFPPFPDRPEFDIYARLEPAREVGGDFYDFFPVDHRHVCFVIGDVSGKGVPASLFMAVTKTLIKVVATSGVMPGEILTRVNAELTQENDSCMFVTVFCALLDAREGEILYANAGHNTPMLVGPGGNVVDIEPTHDPILGVVESLAYTTRRVVLRPGDRLFLYTDGVTEAMNDKDELFSEERLRKHLAALRERPMEEMVQGLMAAIASFARGVPQFDDITMMTVQYRGEQPGQAGAPL